jgi:hypothetical protein
MTVRLHSVGDEDTHVWDLHDMVDGVNHLDPVAKMLAVAAPVRFSFRAELSGLRTSPHISFLLTITVTMRTLISPRTCVTTGGHTGELFVVDVVLVYLPLKFEGEVYSELFETSDENARPLPQQTCLTYWEGRLITGGQVTLEVLKDRKHLNASLKNTNVVGQDQLSRVKGFVFAGKPFGVDETKVPPPHLSGSTSCFFFFLSAVLPGGLLCINTRLYF